LQADTLNYRSFASDSFTKEISRISGNGTDTSLRGSIVVPLLQNRRLTLLLLLVITVHLGLSAAGFPGWCCPFETFTGIPCPGCGLSTAMIHFLTGNWQVAMATHMLAPLALMGILILGSLAITPDRYRKEVAQWIAIVEQKPYLIPMLGGVACVNWGIQIVRLW
jgi:hypothetical protein